MSTWIRPPASLPTMSTLYVLLLILSPLLSQGRTAQTQFRSRGGLDTLRRRVMEKSISSPLSKSSRVLINPAKATFEERSIPLMVYRQNKDQSDEDVKKAERTLEYMMDDIKELSLKAEQEERKKAPKLSSIFLTVATALGFSLTAPYCFPHAVGHILIPSSAVTIFAASSAAEYKGTEASAEAKEIASVALAKAARAEILLSRAEKARSVIPLMVGISASAATFNLVFPALLHDGVKVSPLFIALCPAIATTAAALGAAASVETLAQGLLALGERGADRILSVREATTDDLRMEVAKQRIVPIAKAVLPAFACALLPLPYVNKCIVSSALAAVAAAYSFMEAEAVCGECLVKVANLARASAKSEVLANDAKAQSAVLPFSSAIAGLSLASAAAVCEFSMEAAAGIPAIGAVAAGISNQAAAKSRKDASDARLAFLDEKLQKMASPQEVPDLALRVMPPLVGGMAGAGAKIISNAITDRISGNSGKKSSSGSERSSVGRSIEPSASAPQPAGVPVSETSTTAMMAKWKDNTEEDFKDSATVVPRRKSKAERFLWQGNENKV